MRAKYPVLLCVLVLFCLSLTSCSAKGKGAPLRICFDVGNGNDQYNGSSQTEQAVKAFLTDYDVFTQKYGWARSQDFEIEIIPSASKFSTERAATLQRIRTEIMTGGGPDNNTTMIGLLIFNNAFVYGKYGLACAQAIMLAIVIAALTAVQFKVAGDDVEY